jgi:DNA polymerase elongation subunit (family B)
LRAPLCGGADFDADDGADDVDDEDEDDEDADADAGSAGSRDACTQPYVYDLTTANHRFHAGVGSLVVHNTDSIFVTFANRAPDGSLLLRGRDALASSIQRAQHVSRSIRPLLPPPHNLAYEKTLFPFLLLSKKRYVGLLYEDDPDLAAPKQKSMGIALKRRDYAPIVKSVYGGIIDIVLQHRDVPRAVAFLEARLRDLAEGRYELDDLVISKTLRSYYKFPAQIAHWVLSRRMYARDPGSAPQVNDRIPYVFVENPSAAALMGDRIEHVQFVRDALAQQQQQQQAKATAPAQAQARDGKTKAKRDKGPRIDMCMYIERQIMKPCTQLLAIALEQLPKYRHQAQLSAPDALRQLAAASYGGDEAKARDRLGTLREREVARLLFEPVLGPLKRAATNRLGGQLEITTFGVRRPAKPAVDEQAEEGCSS